MNTSEDLVDTWNLNEIEKIVLLNWLSGFFIPQTDYLLKSFSPELCPKWY